LNNSDKNHYSDFSVPYYEISFDRFFQFGLSVDCVVLGYDDERLKILIIKRGMAPFKGKWALPGDLVYPNENIDVAARRILKDLTGIEVSFLEQTNVYADVGRHPVARVVTTGYYSLLDISKCKVQPSAWAEEAAWFDVDDIPDLPFDHQQILSDTLRILKRKVRTRPIGFELLPVKFTLASLQRLYEALLNDTYDKANFRKRILAMKLLDRTNEIEVNVRHRPAMLYKFNEKRYQELIGKGFSFEL
jgi:8-oxo-dGTP diphosphatase